MAKTPRSLFDRIAGVRADHGEYDFEEMPPRDMSIPNTMDTMDITSETPAGHLPIDMFQTPTEIVIRSFVAGVRPDELAVSIRRDEVTIEGSRVERSEVQDSDYYGQELFWGAFARTIPLPEEVDVENCAASAKDGLLTLVLPKLDRAKQTKLRVRVG